MSPPCLTLPVFMIYWQRCKGCFDRNLEHTTRSDVRVVEGARLEIWCGARPHRGFESHSLRSYHLEEAQLSNGCAFRFPWSNFQSSFMRPGHALHGWNISFCNFIIHKVLSQLLQATSITAIHVQSTQSIVLKVPLQIKKSPKEQASFGAKANNV